jgi:peptidase M20/M25/M40-like protein
VFQNARHLIHVIKATRNRTGEGSWKPILRDRPPEDGGHEISLDSLNLPLAGEWRVYARSASDDKAPIMALMAALDALRAGNIPLSVNLKLFFEGEEGAG